jgi:hypothetical protein
MCCSGGQVGRFFCRGVVSLRLAKIGDVAVRASRGGMA